MIIPNNAISRNVPNPDKSIFSFEPISANTPNIIAVASNTHSIELISNAINITENVTIKDENGNTTDGGTGSGKSSLVMEILCKGALNYLYKTKDKPKQS